jgi:integrase
MNGTELKNDTEVKKWFSGINASYNTKQSYLQAMQAYTEMTGKTPEQLILEAEAEVRAGKLMRERMIFTYLPEFRELLESKELAPLTIKNRMTGVCSFYKYNNIELPVLPKNMSRARPQKKRRDIPTKEDIQAILKFCDPLERALVLVGASSGLAATEISNLKVGDFKKGQDDKTKITVLHVTRTKENDYEFHSCLSPEATTAIETYLVYRNRAIETEDKERLEQLEKQRVTSDNDYLFISRAVPDDYLSFNDLDKSKKENAKIKEEMRKLDTTAIMAIYRRLSEKAQKSAPSGDWNIIRSHNLRRFFNTTLLNEGASIFMVDYLMGHVLDSTHDGYYRGNPQQLRELYGEYVHLVTINKETDEELLQKYEEEVKKSKALETDVVKMAIERTELQELKEQLELERADRVEYERNVDSLMDLKMAEFSKKMMDGFNESMKRIAKNIKEPPIELKDE